MKSFARKLAITGGAAVVLLGVGGTTTTITAHAADATALHCVITGTATISPGLGAPPGSPQSFSYTGTAKCHGVLAGTPVTVLNAGTISGSGSCGVTGSGNGSLATCTQTLPPISASLSDGGASLSANGSYVQAGGNITVEASGSDSGGGAVTVEADAVFTPVGTGTPVTSVTFTGTATAHSS